MSSLAEQPTPHHAAALNAETSQSGVVDGERTPAWLKLEARDVLDAAWDSLRGVYDPELYLDVVSLGLVYAVRAEDGGVVVEMTMTTPGCPASEILPELARNAISDAVGATIPVDVHVVWDPPWNPSMIDEDAARALGFRPR